MTTLRKLICAAGVFVALAVASTAQAGVWRPGENYRVTEDDATGLLEDTYDHAYCNGVPRFGHSGEFPYEEFTVFDCTLTGTWSTGDAYVCDYRYKAIKGSKRGWFKLRKLRGDCTY